MAKTYRLKADYSNLEESTTILRNGSTLIEVAYQVEHVTQVNHAICIGIPCYLNHRTNRRQKTHLRR
jgi:hypothetical protein